MKFNFVFKSKPAPNYLTEYSKDAFLRLAPYLGEESTVHLNFEMHMNVCSLSAIVHGEQGIVCASAEAKDYFHGIDQVASKILTQVAKGQMKKRNLRLLRSDAPSPSTGSLPKYRKAS